MKNLSLLLILISFSLFSCNQNADKPKDNEVTIEKETIIIVEKKTPKTVDNSIKKVTEESTIKKDEEKNEIIEPSDLYKDAKVINGGDLAMDPNSYLFDQKKYADYNLIRFVVRLSADKIAASETIKGSIIPKLTLDKIINAPSGSLLAFKDIYIELSGDTINIPNSYYKLK